MEIERIVRCAVPQPAMGDARDGLGAGPGGAGGPGLRHPAILHEAELRTLVHHRAIAFGKLARFRAVDDDLRDGELAVERFTARFEIDCACQALQLFGERAVGGRHGDEFAQRCRARGSIGSGESELGLRRLGGKGLGHLLLHEDRSVFGDDLVRHFGLGEDDRRGGIRFLCHGPGTLDPGKRKNCSSGDTRACGKRSFEHETDTFGGEHLSQAGINRAFLASLSDP